MHPSKDRCFFLLVVEQSSLWAPVSNLSVRRTCLSSSNGWLVGKCPCSMSSCLNQSSISLKIRQVSTFARFSSINYCTVLKVSTLVLWRTFNEKFFVLSIGESSQIELDRIISFGRPIIVNEQKIFETYLQWASFVEPTLFGRPCLLEGWIRSICQTSVKLSVFNISMEQSL